MVHGSFTIAKYSNQYKVDAFEGLVEFWCIFDPVIIYNKDIESCRTCQAISTTMPRMTGFFKQVQMGALPNNSHIFKVPIVIRRLPYPFLNPEGNFKVLNASKSY